MTNKKVEPKPIANSGKEVAVREDDTFFYDLFEYILMEMGLHELQDPSYLYVSRKFGRKENMMLSFMHHKYHGCSGKRAIELIIQSAAFQWGPVPYDADYVKKATDRVMNNLSYVSLANILKCS